MNSKFFLSALAIAFLITNIVFVVKHNEFKTQEQAARQDSLRKVAHADSLWRDLNMGHEVIAKNYQPSCTVLEYDTIQVGGGFCGTPIRDSIVTIKRVNKPQYILRLKSNCSKKIKFESVTRQVFDNSHIGSTFETNISILEHMNYSNSNDVRFLQRVIDMQDNMIAGLRYDLGYYLYKEDAPHGY